MSLKVFTRAYWTSPEPVLIKGKEIPLLTRFQSLAGDCQKLTHGTLTWVNKAINTYGLPADHPFAQKVMQAISKTKAQGEKIVHADAKEESNEPIVKQGLLTINEMIDKIKKEGSSWTAVHLNNLNDELVQGSILSNTAIEKYLKGIFVVSGIIGESINETFFIPSITE